MTVKLVFSFRGPDCQRSLFKRRHRLDNDTVGAAFFERLDLLDEGVRHLRLADLSQRLEELTGWAYRAYDVASGWSLASSVFAPRDG